MLEKRGVKHLSVFELVVILGLGSAAGDPMIYKEMVSLSALAALSVIVVCYKLLTFLVFKFKWQNTLYKVRKFKLLKKANSLLVSLKKNR